jgi:type I restriction enzyme S subunit
MSRPTDYPHDWDVKTLGEAATYINGRAFSTDERGEKGLPMIRIQQMRDPEAEVDRFDGEVEEKHLIDDGDLLFSWSATLMTRIWDRGPAVLNQHIFKVVPAPDVSKSYLHYLLDFVMEDLAKQSHGTTMKHVKKSDLRPFEVILPPFPEQRRIADVLDTVDAAIQETDAVVEKQEQVKTGLLQDLLTRGLDAEGRLRDPEREPEAFRETDLGFRPVEWDVESAGEILNGITQGWSPKCRPDPASQGQWGVLRTTSVQWSGFTEVENKALPSDLSPRPEYEVEALDVLMTRAGPASRVGVVALVEDVRGKLLLSDKLYRLEHRDDILPRFLHAALSSEKIQNLLGREKTGMAGSQTNISQRIVKDLPFPHPPIEEQKRIVSVLKEHSGHIEGERAYRSKLQSLKNGLMQDLLTGRIRVPEAQERVDEVIA